MKTLHYIIIIVISILYISCNNTTKKDNPTEKYIFFLHNKFLEENPSGSYVPEYKVKAEYDEIVASFRKDRFIVISEKRKPKTNWIEYAEKVHFQIDSLELKGVSPKDITVIGTSKGGYIAQYVSTIAKNPDLNFVFIGAYQDTDIEEIPEINFCGNILTIYEKTDPYGVSAIKRKEQSKLPIKKFKEIELNTGLQHGFLYIASEKWIEPCKKWAKQE